MKANDYMKRMMKTVVSHKEKAGIRKELQDCIDDLMEAYMEQGMSEEEAEEEAIRQMGDPYEAAEMFNEVYQPRFEWRVALYTVIWIIITKVIFWGLEASFGASNYNVMSKTIMGAICIIVGIAWSYSEKTGDQPLLWMYKSKSNLLWVFSNSSAEVGIGIGCIAVNVQQIIILYGLLTIIMLFQRLFVEIEQNKMEQRFLYKECTALKDFDFEAYAYIENEKHLVRMRAGQKAKKGDCLIVTGMKGLTFVVEKFQ